MSNFENPSQLTVRKSREKRIEDYHKSGDSNHANMELDLWPYGKERKPLGVVALYQTLKRKGSKAARFFEKEAIAEASQDTTEIPAVTQEMLDAA